MDRTIEFWFDFGSNYSYIASTRIEALAQPLGAKVLWKPFMLGPIFKSFGWESSPFVIQKQKGAYAWIDMERQCRKYGIPWKKPSEFPRAAVYPMRVAAANEGAPWLAEFCRRVFKANFADDLDINSNEFAAGVLKAMGEPGDEIVAAAQVEPKKSLLRTQSERAAELGIFGAPSFFVGGEMYWGNDRLEDALSRLRELSS
jgi:2-hydroxychromene-2-carboxylate isomerase